MESLQLLQLRERKKKCWQEKLKKLEAVEEWYKNFPLIPTYRPCLQDPAPFWHTVYRQKHAFDVASVHPEDVHVFAFEVDGATSDVTTKGQRKYVITNYLQLWHAIYHLATHNKHACFYEVIPEGSACKLYFDLEFSRSLNPECNGVEMVHSFIKFVCNQIADVYQIHCGVRQVINLDATTDGKFSRHLIFNLPQAVFKDNVQAGNFVHRICKKITGICQRTAKQSIDEDGEPVPKRPKQHDETDKRSDSTISQLQNLFVQNKDGQSVLFVDQGVYTRNRNFRLYKCIKQGKANPLLIADDNQYKPHLPKKSSGSDATIERQFFLDSLITNVRYSSNMTVLTMDLDDKHRTTDPVKKQSIDKTDLSHDHLQGFDHSPYPELDNFIRTVVTKGGIQGEVRRWVYFTQGQLLIYDIIKNRWCGHVQRHHKSNNIMILADLRHGVYYQKCHDPDCKAAGYKSADTPLPSQLLPSFLDDYDDDELLAAVNQAERDGTTLVTGYTGMHSVGEVSDDELLAAAIQVEDGQKENLHIGAEQRSEVVCVSQDGCIDNVDTVGVTESDEELLAAMAGTVGESEVMH